jgi:hypothetical protein
MNNMAGNAKAINRVSLIRFGFNERIPPGSRINDDLLYFYSSSEKHQYETTTPLPAREKKPDFCDACSFYSCWMQKRRFVATTTK